MEPVRFGNVLLVGSRAIELAAAAEVFSKTPEGVEVGRLGSEGGKRTKRLLSGGPTGELAPYVGHEAEHKVATIEAGKKMFDVLQRLGEDEE